MTWDVFKLIQPGWSSGYKHFGILYFSSWVISLLVARRIHDRVVSIRCTMVRGKGASLKKTLRRLAPAVTVKRIALWHVVFTGVVRFGIYGFGMLLVFKPCGGYSWVYVTICPHGHSHGFLIWPPTFANQFPCWVESQFFVYHFISPGKLESFCSIDS